MLENDWKTMLSQKIKERLIETNETFYQLAKQPKSSDNNNENNTSDSPLATRRELRELSP